MLSQFKLPEALAWLEEQTGRQWTDSELFQVCVNRGVPLHAAPPLDARCIVVEMNPDDPAGVRVAMRLGWRKAILHPWQVGQLWQAGETEPAPVNGEFNEPGPGRWSVFDPPVRVTRDHLAIRRDTLARIVEAWRRYEAAPAGMPPANTSERATDLPPLYTGDMAFCFDGLRYTEAQWKKPLGNMPKWLMSCLVEPGRQGGNQRKWNPVLIGAALVASGHVPARRVRARFQTHPTLRPWLEAWKTYEADYIDSD